MDEVVSVVVSVREPVGQLLLICLVPGHPRVSLKQEPNNSERPPETEVFMDQMDPPFFIKVKLKTLIIIDLDFTVKYNTHL